MIDAIKRYKLTCIRG